MFLNFCLGNYFVDDFIAEVRMLGAMATTRNEVFRWGTHLYMSLFLSVCPSICRASYFRNCTSCDHYFCTHDFLGQKRAKQPKIKNKNYVRHTSYLRNSIGYDHDFWYIFVKWWYLQVLFSFFQNFYFLGP